MLMSSKLTKTEELAAKLYFNDGLKPKEIAQKLGISVNTVYKAISKYRAFTMKNGEQTVSQMYNDYGTTNPKAEDNSYSSNSDYGNYIFNVKLSIITNYAPDSSLNNYSDLIYQGELMKELKALKELISKLIDKVEELERRSNINCQNNIQTRDEQSDNEYLVPDFIRDNPWVDVLRLKRDS